MASSGTSADRAVDSCAVPAPAPLVLLNSELPHVRGSEIENAKLIIAPGVVRTWEEFVAESPRYSIALDGYVSGPTNLEGDSYHVNFNHHEGAEGPITRSTSGQVAILLKEDFVPDFLGDPPHDPAIYINHPDQDSSLASWLLMNSEELLKSTVESRLQALIALEGRLDVTCGLYNMNIGTTDLYREMIWVFSPYTDARARGNGHMTGDKMAEIVTDVHYRIGMFCMGKAEKREPDFRYEIIGGGPGWAMVRETGAHCRAVFLRDGIKAFVSCFGEKDGRYFYSICKATPLVRGFPMPQVFAFLNELEGIPPDCTARWNGGMVAGGSPRGIGSALSPKDLQDGLRRFLEKGDGSYFPGGK